MKIGDFEDIPDYETFVKDNYRCLAGVDENVAPTILDIAGVPVYDAMDGVSFKSLLQGKKIEWRKDFLCEYYEYPGAHLARKNRGVRTERWKYIHFFEEPQEFELYDMHNDPHEMVNLINDPTYKPVVERLRRRMTQLRRGLHDPDL